MRFLTKIKVYSTPKYVIKKTKWVNNCTLFIVFIKNYGFRFNKQ